MGETGCTTGALKKNINSISIIQNKNFVIEYKKSKCRIKIKITMKAFVLFLLITSYMCHRIDKNIFLLSFALKLDNILMSNRVLRGSQTMSSTSNRHFKIENSNTNKITC